LSSHPFSFALSVDIDLYLAPLGGNTELGYPAVNSEKTIFMKRKGEHFIIHGLFVDDMMHTTTSTTLARVSDTAQLDVLVQW
jgi:hypothetical protein